MVASVTQSNQIATVHLNRPEAMNTISLDGFGALRTIFENLRDDDNVRAIILTGEGRAFCAGAALDSFVTDGSLTITPDLLRDAFDQNLNPLLRVLMDLPKPLVIAINGTVAGGGMGLALAGDVVIASDKARFFCGFVQMLALVPDVGTSWVLPNLMGRNRALPLALLGESLTAQEALDTGLIYRVAPDDAVLPEAQAYAERLMQAPTEALRRTRQLFTAANSMTYSDMLDQERDANCALVNRPELAEGVAAFLEKRSPDFAGASHARKDN